MPIWLLSLIITFLQKTGLETAAAAWIERRGLAAIKAIENLKVYTTAQPGDVTPPYPEGKNSGL